MVDNSIISFHDLFYSFANMISPKRTISVIVPLYNKEDYVLDAIKSALDQTYKEIEIIVIDDGSTDRSAEIVRSFDDSRLRLLQQSNKGVSCARNFGVERSTGDLIAFLDADDIWLKDHIAHLVRLWQKFPEASIYCNQFTVGRKVKKCSDSSEKVSYIKVDNYVSAALDGCARIWTSALMIHRKVFNEAGGFPIGVSHGEDLSLWLKATVSYPVAFSSYMGAIYRKDEAGLSAKLVKYPDGSISAIDDILSKSILNSNRIIDYKDLRASFALSHVITAYGYGRNDVAQDFLVEASGSKRFKKKYRILKILSYFPAQINALLVKSYRMFF